MSGKIMGGVYDLELPHHEQSILLALADHADQQGENSYPSYGLIAWKTGYSVRQVQRIIKRLTADGLLERMGISERDTIKFRINLSAGKPKTKYTGRACLPVHPRVKMSLSDTQMTRPPVTSGCPAPCDIWVSHEPSVEPSLEPALTQHEKTITTVPVYSSKSKAPPDELPVLPTVATTTSPRAVPSTTDPRIRTYVLEFGIQPNDAQKFEIVDRIKSNDPQWEKTLHDFHINEPERNWSRVGWLCDRYEQANKPKPQRQPVRGQQPQQTRVPKGTRAPILEPDPHANDEVFKQLREMGMKI